MPLRSFVYWAITRRSFRSFQLFSTPSSAGTAGGEILPSRGTEMGESGAFAPVLVAFRSFSKRAALPVLSLMSGRLEYNGALEIIVVPFGPTP
jgi:hypothetical protein